MSVDLDRLDELAMEAARYAVLYEPHDLDAAEAGARAAIGVLVKRIRELEAKLAVSVPIDIPEDFKGQPEIVAVEVMNARMRELERGLPEPCGARIRVRDANLRELEAEVERLRNPPAFVHKPYSLEGHAPLCPGRPGWKGTCTCGAQGLRLRHTNDREAG